MLMLLSSSTSSALMPALTPRLRQPAHASPTVRMQFDFFGGGGGKKKTAAKSKSPLDFFGGGDGKTDGGGLPEAVFQWPPNMQTFVSILKCLSKNSMNSLLTFTKKWAFLLLSKMSTSPSSLGRN